MNTIIFLIVWLSTPSADGDVTAAQFVTSFHSMKECTAVRKHIEISTPGAKGRVACMEIVASPLEDAGAAF